MAELSVGMLFLMLLKDSTGAAVGTARPNGVREGRVQMPMTLGACSVGCWHVGLGTS